MFCGSLITFSQIADFTHLAELQEELGEWISPTELIRAGTSGSSQCEISVSTDMFYRVHSAAWSERRC